MQTLPCNLQVLTLTNRRAARSAGLTGAQAGRIAHRMSTRDRMTEKLNAAFAPVRLDVEDESHHHIGHAGSRPEGETHYRVHIVSDAFQGKSRIERHRLVNAVLKDELAGGVHALAIHASAPGEEGALG